MVSTEEWDRDKEREHTDKALRNCGYLDWALVKCTTPPQDHDRANREKGRTTCPITLPYTTRLSEMVHRIFRNHGCSTSFKPGNTLRQLLVTPKYLARKKETCGVLYRIDCEGGKEDRECHRFYVGETGRMLKTWLSIWSHDITNYHVVAMGSHIILHCMMF